MIEEIGNSREVDSVVLTGYFGGYSVEAGEGADAGERQSEVALRMAAAARSGVPLLAQTMHWDSSPAMALRDSGVPIFARIDDAITALGRIVSTPPEGDGILSLPPPQTPIEGEGYWVAREALSGAVPLAESRRVGGREEALAAAAEIGYPVALKATDILHKSDLGGVALGLAGDAALGRAFDSMSGLGSGSYAVERMAPVAEGVELLLGSRRDPRRFGPVIAIGIGGVYTELLDDVAIGLAPLGPGEADRLLRSLRGAPLLLGARGRAQLDLAAAASAAVALSNLVAAHPEISEIEVNPLLVLEQGVLGLDARIVRAGPG